MFVMTAKRGESFKNDRSLSSASATRYLPRPSLALLPNELTRPPITTVGSRPATSSTRAIIDVVVVLPCAPATAIPWRSCMSSARTSARATTGKPRSRAATISGLVDRTADEYTTSSTSLTLRASCPCVMRAPSDSSRSVMSVRCISDPLTTYPRLTSSSAMPLIPMPPMPMK